MSYLKYSAVLLSGLVLIAQAKGEPETFYLEDEVPADFGQERSLNFLDVQLPSKQPQPETAFEFNSVYMQPSTFMDYYANPMYYVPQNPQYAYNAPLFPAPGYYTPSTYIDHFIKPSVANSFEAASKPSAAPPVVFIKPTSQRPATSKPLLQENLTQLLSNLINKQPSDWHLYNSAVPQKELLEVDQQTVNRPNKDLDKLSALFTQPGKKPDLSLPSFSKPENLVNLKPLLTTPTTTMDALLENLLQQLLSRKRTEERLGAFYLKKSLMNRK